MAGGYKGAYDATVHGSYIDDLVKKFPAKVTNLSQVPSVAAIAALLPSPSPMSLISF